LISFFRINDPFRYLAIIGLMLFFASIYIFLLGAPMLQPEMIWLLIGERISQGHHMYIDIIDDTGPLASGVYWILHELVGRNLGVYKIMSGGIMLFQLIYLNNLFIKYKSFNENTYIPAFVMCVLFFLSFDLMTLSPALMGSTFVLLALGQLFSQTVLQKEGTDSVLLMGLFGGIAACFHFPYVTFFPFLLFTGIAVSGISFQQFLLAMFGYFLPLMFCAVYFFWIDGLQDFITEYVFASRLIEAYPHVGLRDLLLLFLLPLILAGLGFLISNFFRPLTVNQQKQSQIILIYFGFAFLSFFLSNRRTFFQWLVLMPALTYYISHLFMTFKKGYASQILSLVFVFFIPLMGFGWIFYKINTETISSYSVEVKEKHKKIQKSKILVLGDDLAYYHSSSLATPYLNYGLTKMLLENPDDLVRINATYLKFVNEKPEYIIDEDGVFEDLAAKIPRLSALYKKLPGNIFQLETQ
jgi:hypothetical protein